MNISNPYLLAALGCGFTFLMTSLGAATIFFIRKDIKQDLQSIFLGFAAGVMIAASVYKIFRRVLRFLFLCIKRVSANPRHFYMEALVESWS